MTKRTVLALTVCSAMIFALACGGGEEPAEPSPAAPQEADSPVLGLVDEAGEVVDQVTETATQAVDEVVEGIEEAVDQATEAAMQTVDEIEIIETIEGAVDEANMPVPQTFDQVEGLIGGSAQREWDGRSIYFEAVTTEPASAPKD